MKTQQETTKQKRLARREATQQQAEAARRRQRRSRWLWLGGGGVTLVVVIAAIIFAARAQAAPTIAGIQCNQSEGTVTHIHQHLAIYDKGTPVIVPADIGINAAQGCLFWLHTHDSTGVIHVESPNQGTTYTLGQFFAIWGQPLSGTRVASAVATGSAHVRAYVNGRLYTGDPRSIPLTQHARITLEVGPPWVSPPSFTFTNGE